MTQPPPAPASSRAEYQRRMHRVLAHIDQQLDQPLDLATSTRRRRK